MAATVGSFQAKTHLASLLDRVARGESITITKLRQARSPARSGAARARPRRREGRPRDAGVPRQERPGARRRCDDPRPDRRRPPDLTGTGMESLRLPKERLVLDCSVALCWYFRDEADPYADGVAKRLTSAEAVVPSLWPLEIANAVLMGERRNRSTQAEAQRWIAVLETLPITLDGETAARAWDDTLNCAGPESLRLRRRVSGTCAPSGPAARDPRRRTEGRGTGCRRAPLPGGVLSGELKLHKPAPSPDSLRAM